ncbi:MAG TPA: hypothetical protein VHB02_02500 [Acidimicrobiales bacterium]|nr:hypothetical protein [Acidimicrobiales bacterium]
MTAITALPTLPDFPIPPGLTPNDVRRPTMALGSSTHRPPDRTARVNVVPWDDPVVEAAGFDPRSTYVERFWLPLLGPSAAWLLRRIADGFDAHPDGFELDLDDTARSLGLGGLGSRHSPFRRAILRCARYGLARHAGTGVLAARRAVTPIPQRHVARLPASLQEQHARWAEPRPVMAFERRRARLLGLDLAVLGHDRAGVERELLRWGMHPALAYESAGWASSRPAFDPPGGTAEATHR